MDENNWAIVVGINQYEHLPSNDHLKYAVRDAINVQKFLCEQAQFPSDNVLLCCDSTPGVSPMQRPSRSGLRDLLLNQIQRAKDADNFWFFFAGHGIVHERQDFLLPCDGNPKDLEATAIPISFVTDCLRDCGANNVVLVLDMCRNRTRSADEGSRAVGEEMGMQTLEIARERGIVTLFSCSREQRSYEIADLQQGAFTYALLEGLKQSTTPRALEEYLRNRVPALNHQYGKPTQVPMVIPEPGWKYDRPLLLSCATPEDIRQLKDQAREAELEGDYDSAKSLWRRAESLWRQVILAPHSTQSDRAEAMMAIERILTKLETIIKKLEITPPPQPPSIFEFEVVTVDARGQITDRRKGEAEYRREDLGNGVTLDLVAIPGGKFLMGSPDSEEGRSDGEGPQHEVTISPFYMGKYPVTQVQWRAVATLPKIETKLKSQPSKFKGDNRPVELISWEDAIEFCARLSKKTGREYRLPSEAEWEYVCRGGTETPFYFGKTITPDLANYDGNYTYGSGPKGQYRLETTEVGNFPPNAFGLYDMHGNVWEWCLDHWHENYQGAPRDGSAWVTGDDRVLRGGSWNYVPRVCRSAYRLRAVPCFKDHGIGFGFRVVCSST